MNSLQRKTRYARFVFVALFGLTTAGHAPATGITGITGTYTGTYSSFNSNGDSGTVEITVDAYGAVSCDFYSTAKNMHYTASGSANASPSNTGISYGPPGGPFGPVVWLINTSINCVNGPRINPGGPADPVAPPPSTFFAAQVVFLWADSVGLGGYQAGTWISASGDAGEFSVGFPPSTNATAVINSAALTGLWYDPKYSGSGFNIVESTAGLIVTYYGWDKSGQRLWLTSAIGPSQIALGQSITLNLTQTVNGTFVTPASPSTAAPWGTITLTFTGCTSATATLTGADGGMTESLTLLVGLSGLGCQ